MTASVLSENIKALRRHLGDNQEQFAARIEARQQSYVSKWERLGVIPSTEYLETMAGLAGCPIRDFVNKPWRPSEIEVDRLPDLPSTLPTSSDDDTVEITAVDLSLSMGPGTLIEDYPEEERVRMSLNFLQAITRTPSDRLRLVRGIGDSMEPTLRSGDRIMVDLNERQLARSHGVYWIDHLGTHGIKRLRASRPGKVMVMSDNPLVPDFEVDAVDLRIEGRVIWFARDL